MKTKEYKTTLVITVVINHDSEAVKQQGLDVWCEDLKEGQYVRGFNGNGERYDLTVTNIKESI